MDAETSSGQVLEFLTVTCLPHRGVGNEEARRIVRSHAIRDANRRKRSKADLEGKQTRGAATQEPPAQSSLTTKFKLNKKPAKERKKTTPPRNEEWEYFLAGTALRRVSSSILTLAPGIGEFDPFDSLPIKLGPKQQALLDYQKCRLEQSAFCIGSKEALFTFAARDPAWLNSILCLISLHYDLQVGKGISHECLMHRAEALRIVNQRLRESPQNIAEETIGAIAALANFETSNGHFENATMHVNGLIDILASREPAVEGLLPLENIFLQKVVAWVDLSYCTAWDLSPKLPLLASGVCRSDIHEFAFFLLGLYPPDTKVYSPHDLVGELAIIFQVLRLLSIRIHSLPRDVYGRMVYDRGLYMSEYKLLTVLDSLDALDDGIAMPSRNSRIYGSCRLAAYLYLYLVLRELPTSAVIVQTILKRLEGILEKAKGDILTMWREDQHLFLWILYMGAIASIGSSERGFFVQILRRMIMQMGLHTMEAFTGALKEVLWEPGFCEGGSITRRLWAELQRQ